MSGLAGAQQTRVGCLTLGGRSWIAGATSPDGAFHTGHAELAQLALTRTGRATAASADSPHSGAVSDARALGPTTPARAHGGATRAHVRASVRGKAGALGYVDFPVLQQLAG